jgi:acyl carrier protein
VTERTIAEADLRELLLQALRGGSYDLADLERRLSPDARFDDLGLDSLDLTDFILRIEDLYQVKIRQEEYPNLSSLARVRAYLESTDGAGAPGG